MGGAIFDQGTLDLRQVTLSANEAHGGSTASGGDYGGGGIGQDAPGSHSGGGFGGSAPGASGVGIGGAEGVIGPAGNGEIGGGGENLNGNAGSGGFGAGGGEGLSGNGGSGGFGAGGGEGVGGSAGSGGFGAGSASADGGGGAGMGGAVFVLYGTASVTDSTLADNTAAGGASGSGGAGDGLGGAIFNLDGSLSLDGSTIALNSTSGGSGPDGGLEGGGVYSLATASTGAGGSATSASISVSGAILSGNHGGIALDDLMLNQDSGDPSHTSASTLASPDVISVDGVANGAGGTGGSLVVGDPLLGSLQVNGSGPATIVPGAGSPAIGAGTSCDATDELGYARPTSGCTLGAFEVEQVINFTSTAPTNASVGGQYTPTASGGGSGNAVTYSIDASSTPGACSLSGRTVTFGGPGTCTIDANEAAGGAYAVAAQTQQTFTIASPPTTTTSTTTTTTSASTSTSTSTIATTATAIATTTRSTATTPASPTGDSQFVMPHAPYVNTTTGTVSVYLHADDAGTLSWQALYRNHRGYLAITAKRCPAFQQWMRGTCRPQWLVFARGTQTVTAAGAVTLAISPSALATKLLERLRTEHRAGIRIAVVMTFQSAYGGPPVRHIETVRVTLHDAATASRHHG